MRPAALRGHVSVAQVGTATGAGATRSTPLISLTVTGREAAEHRQPRRTRSQTSSSRRRPPPYVGVKIRTFRATLKSVNSQLDSINRRLAVLTAATKAAKNLNPLDQLVIVSQEDNAEARLGNLIAQQETLQQQLAFATQVESAKIIVPARAVKASAHSRRSSLLVGALIGLILGAIVAIVVDARSPRTA